MSIIDVVGVTEFGVAVNVNRTVLVDFWAPWCGPCRMLSSSLDELSTASKSVTIVKVNVDDNQELVAKYRVNSVPTMILFKNGVEIKSRSGCASASDLRLWIEQ